MIHNGLLWKRLLIWSKSVQRKIQQTWWQILSRWKSSEYPWTSLRFFKVKWRWALGREACEVTKEGRKRIWWCEGQFLQRTYGMWVKVEIVSILGVSYSSKKNTRQNREDFNWFSSKKCAHNMHKVKLSKVWVKLSKAIKVAFDCSEIPFTIWDSIQSWDGAFHSSELSFALGKGPFERWFRAFDSAWRFSELVLFSEYEFELVSDSYFLRAVNWMIKMVLLNI